MAEIVCTWFDLGDPIFDGPGKVERCNNIAKYTGSCDFRDIPLCEEHKCRHSITFEEDERRKEAERIRNLPTPKHWMAY